MPLSADPNKRAAQLANLQPGRGAAQGENARAISHGAYAKLTPARVDAKVDEVLVALTQDAPVREADGSLPAADAVAVRQLAEVLCRLDDIAEYLMRRGWEDESSKPRPVLEYEGRLRGHVLELLREMGMTPASRAKLGLDLARTKRTMQEEIDAELADIAARREPAVDATAEEVA